MLFSDEDPSTGCEGEFPSDVERNYNYNALPANVVGAQVIEILKDVGKLKNKSKNIKGTIARDMDAGLRAARGAVSALMGRIGGNKDIQILKNKNLLLEGELKDTKKELLSLRDEIRILKKRVGFQTNDRLDSAEDSLQMPPSILRRRGSTSSVISQVRMQQGRGEPLEGGVAPEQWQQQQQRRQQRRRSFLQGKKRILDKSNRNRLAQDFAREMEAFLIHKNEMDKKVNYLQDIVTNLVLDNYDCNEDKNNNSVNDSQDSVINRTFSRMATEKVLPSQFCDLTSQSGVEVESEGGWTTIVNRHKRRRSAQVEDMGRTEFAYNSQKAAYKEKTMGMMRTPRRRIPKTAAVAITGKGENFSYADALKKARENISLREIGIKATRVRVAGNGGILIEVPGPEGMRMADELAYRLRGVLADVVVSRPTRKAEIRIVGLDVSTTPQEVANVFAEMGECEKSEVKVSNVRQLRNGLGVAWAQLPLVAALKITKEERVEIGWTIARVFLLQAKPVQCFKCWEYGHTRYGCRSSTERAGSCFRCGGEGHAAKGCGLPACCVLCKEAGLTYTHKMGSASCGMRPAGGTHAGRRPQTIIERNIT